MKNPNPIARARRIEMRRKQLGYPCRCFYCPETELFCFEQDHPVTEGLDEDFKRVVCRNCHRKSEASRDIKGLTKNGQHDVVESEIEKVCRYLLLMAEDEDSQAELLQREPNAPITLIIKASQARAASLRRKAQALSLSNLPVASAAVGLRLNAQ
jgi:hypothetical protein